MKILLASSKGSLHDLAQVLIGKSCIDPGEVLFKHLQPGSFVIFVQVIVRRSCAGSKILSKRSPWT